VSVVLDHMMKEILVNRNVDYIAMSKLVALASAEVQPQVCIDHLIDQLLSTDLNLDLDGGKDIADWGFALKSNPGAGTNVAAANAAFASAASQAQSTPAAASNGQEKQKTHGRKKGKTVCRGFSVFSLSSAHWSSPFFLLSFLLPLLRSLFCFCCCAWFRCCCCFFLFVLLLLLLFFF
jgi:hypothetical protein